MQQDTRKRLEMSLKGAISAMFLRIIRELIVSHFKFCWFYTDYFRNEKTVDGAVFEIRDRLNHSVKRFVHSGTQPAVLIQMLILVVAKINNIAGNIV